MDDFSSKGSSTRQDLSFFPTGQVSPALPHRMERDDSPPASGASTRMPAIVTTHHQEYAFV